MRAIGTSRPTRACTGRELLLYCPPRSSLDRVAAHACEAETLAAMSPIRIALLETVFTTVSCASSSMERTAEERGVALYTVLVTGGDVPIVQSLCSSWMVLRGSGLSVRKQDGRTARKEPRRFAERVATELNENSRFRASFEVIYFSTEYTPLKTRSTSTRRCVITASPPSLNPAGE